MYESAVDDPGKRAHDMAVYHSQNTHYDLLVRDGSRLALLGLIAGSMVEEESGTSSQE